MKELEEREAELLKQREMINDEIALVRKEMKKIKNSAVEIARGERMRMYYFEGKAIEERKIAGEKYTDIQKDMGVTKSRFARSRSIYKRANMTPRWWVDYIPELKYRIEAERLMDRESGTGYCDDPSRGY